MIDNPLAGSGGGETALSGGSGNDSNSDPDPSGGSAGSGGTSSGGQPNEDVVGAGGSDVDPPDTVQVILDEFAVYWDFESLAGTQVTPSVGVEPLSLIGASLGSGPTGAQLDLNGQSSSASSTGPVVNTSADFSISAWVKLDTLETYNTFVAINGSTVAAGYLQKRSDDRLSFTTFPEDSTASSPCVSTAQIQPRGGEWYFIVATRSAATREQRIYVDGVLSGRIVCPESVFQATNQVTLGQGTYGAEASDWVQGSLDNVGLISRLLSPDEIIQLYQAGRPSANNYLFAYFVEVSEGRGDGLRLAQSHDGLHWGAIGAGKVFMPPSVGGGSFRDPHLMRGPDGKYHLLWTTSCVPWAEANCQQDRGMGHASSSDLVEWSAADYITVDLEVEHVWAPESWYDAQTAQYMIFWSSPPDTSASSDPHNIYYLLTQDFQQFSETKVLYSQPGANFIDATIRSDENGYLMILKDEADGQKNLRALRSTLLFGAGAWTDTPSAALTGNYAAEGPSLLERSGDLFIYFDKYGEGAYGALRAANTANLTAPSSWQDISSSVFFPGVRHGTPIEVPDEVYRAVALAAGK